VLTVRLYPACGCPGQRHHRGDRVTSATCASTNPQPFIPQPSPLADPFVLVALLWSVICGALIWAGIGVLGLAILGVWWIYRIVRGLMAYSRREAMPV